jgi:hypothetical protein
VEQHGGGESVRDHFGLLEQGSDLVRPCRLHLSGQFGDQCDESAASEGVEVEEVGVAGGVVGEFGQRDRRVAVSPRRRERRSACAPRGPTPAVSRSRPVRHRPVRQGRPGRLG